MTPRKLIENETTTAEQAMAMTTTVALATTTSTTVGQVMTNSEGLPLPLFPPGPGVVSHVVTSDGSYTVIQLSRPLQYFSRVYSQLYLSMDGFLSFTPLSYDTYVQVSNIDIIAPLWTDLDMYTRGNVSYEQATSGPLLQTATDEMNRMFPGFSASWVFVATWEKMEFEPDVGEVTFQVVLVSDVQGRTFILMNYGPIPPVDPEPWKAGLQTQENYQNFTIQVPLGGLTTSTNVGTPGRWAFQVSGAAFGSSWTLFPPGPAVVSHAVTGDATYTQIQLTQPLQYFGRSYIQLYLSMDGFLSFTPLSFDTYVQVSNFDIIAPLWTDLDMYTRGNVSYEQATSGPLLQTATDEMNRMFPGFSASWVFVATWEKMEFEPDKGEVTFQVVLISDVQGRTFILMNYGPIPPVDPEPWEAGLQTQENYQNMTIHVPLGSLSTSTNVGIPGRWVFQVAGPAFVPTTMFPIMPFARRLSFYDGGSFLVQLDQPFTYFGSSHTQLYFAMDGFLSFEDIPSDGYYPLTNKDMIAPLWTDIDTYYRGYISYEQATSGPLLQLATYTVRRYFQKSDFTASWVFVGTWDKVEFEPDVGEVTFQVVLISGGNDASYVLMNYGNMPADPEPWMAGYMTANNGNHFIIQAASTSDLRKTTNVGLPGRWAFEVNAPFRLFFPVLPGAVRAVTSDGDNALVQLTQPFSYFGRDYRQLYLSMDGFLSFEPFNFDGYFVILNKDIIAPLWTDIDTYTRGNITYQQATSGPLIAQATAEIRQMYPGSDFTAAWVFVGTWEKVEFEPDLGEVTFQVILISDEDSDVSFILMNYGQIPNNQEAWMAGYQTEDNAHQFRIQAASTADLSRTSNVGRPGRWAFRVDACGVLNCTENEVCVARSGVYGCACANNNPRFNPDNFDATESCDGTNRSVSVSRCQLFEAGFPAEVLHLNDPSCKGVAQDGRLVFHFDDNTCGSILEVNSTNFIYKNSIQSLSSLGPRSVVSRDSWLNLNFSCVYPLIQSISAPMTFQAINSVINKNLPGAEGTYQIRMVPYSDASFTSPFSGTVTLQVNQQVFIAVEVDGVDSHVFSTVLDNCWATPYNDPNHYIRWDLITNECPNAKDGTVQVLQNGVSISSHFSFRMFTFTGVSDSFYLHCRVHLCQVNGGHCALPCDDDDGDEDDMHPIVRRRRSLDFHDSTSISMSF
ncbi:hypothetical protein SRHO_G00163100 [Serrasalmus rhombeus]